MSAYRSWSITMISKIESLPIWPSFITSNANQIITSTCILLEINISIVWLTSEENSSLKVKDFNRFTATVRSQNITYRTTIWQWVIKFEYWKQLTQQRDWSPFNKKLCCITKQLDLFSLRERASLMLTEEVDLTWPVTASD